MINTEQLSLISDHPIHCLLRASVVDLEIQDRRTYPPIHYLQPPQSDRQREPSRSGASRIEIQHSVFHLLLWLMRMAADDRREPGSFGIKVERVQVMDDVDVKPGQFHDFDFGKTPSPRLCIHVAANRGHGCDLFQG